VRPPRDEGVFVATAIRQARRYEEFPAAPIDERDVGLLVHGSSKTDFAERGKRQFFDTPVGVHGEPRPHEAVGIDEVVERDDATAAELECARQTFRPARDHDFVVGEQGLPVTDGDRFCAGGVVERPDRRVEVDDGRERPFGVREAPQTNFRAKAEQERPNARRTRERDADRVERAGIHRNCERCSIKGARALGTGRTPKVRGRGPPVFIVQRLPRIERGLRERFWRHACNSTGSRGGSSASGPPVYCVANAHRIGRRARIGCSCSSALC
jgi:hypothetical protein